MIQSLCNYCERFNAYKLLLIVRQHYVKMSPTPPTLEFSFSFSPQFSQLLLIPKFCLCVLMTKHQKSPLSNPAPFLNIFHILNFFISTASTLIQDSSHSFNKHVLDTYTMLNAICPVLY